MAFDFGLSKLTDILNSAGGGGKNPRPPFEGFYIYALLFFVGMLVADYSTSFLRSKMLPIGGITKTAMRRGDTGLKQKTASIASGLRDRNIFNSDHIIPDPLGLEANCEPGDEACAQRVNNQPVLTNLPIKLMGTIIHGARQLSVATLQMNGKDIVAVMEEETAEDLVKIREITRYKVIFRNLNNDRLEYVEIKEENKIQMGLAGPKGAVKVANAPTQTNFTFQRDVINRHLEDLGSILQQAKAVPYVAPGSGGEVSGWKLVAIKSGSIYEKLGLKRGDIIKNVNGEPVDTAQKAMELYQSLKDSDNIQLEISRGGSATNLNYKIE